MTDEKIQQLIDMNMRLSVLLGYAVSMVQAYDKLEAYHDDSDKCVWFMEAIQAVYANNPLPAYVC